MKKAVPVTARRNIYLMKSTLTGRYFLEIGGGQFTCYRMNCFFEFQILSLTGIRHP